MIIAMIQTFLLALIALYALRTVVAHLCTWYYFSRYARVYPATEYAPPVSIIKPTRGIDASATDNFRSFCEQEYPNVYELLFCVEEPDDPVVPLIQDLIAAYPHRDIRLLVSDPQDTRAAGKLKNMRTGVAASRYDVLIFSDSDVHVSPTFLADTVQCVVQREVGLGFSAPIQEGARCWAAALLNLAVNETVLGITPFCLFQSCHGAIGATMVMRREVLAEIRGLAQFGWQVTDDIPLARAIRARGYRLHLLRHPARMYHPQETLRGWWAHMLRWLVIIRHYAPGLVYSMPVMDMPLVWGLLYAVLAGCSAGEMASGMMITIAVVLFRLLSTAVLNWQFVHDHSLWPYLWVVPLRDLLKLPLLIQSVLTNEIVWRGRRVWVHADGTATYMAQPSQSSLYRAEGS
jgi:ceramide glucosyltransferase